ncbi:hypothetical protein SPRG_15933 [Saprolegnia parasitica CBS 223.65]|uniref:Pentacotripeptide-repeat region of PRORP domain-containing protein n=1 Tax=Saprolegnia parasitica (strain CBS 223.65) TaxID=695850 RepID=A0A067BJV9_SAPPC|nr:hypothetical protein SPRG_15933 [Saprolegnia parasitica CBS 223.65]KDO18714.1 hypothetical protein SPRG_15933 [Saprolegnia parasitica CBS 223.65]|eukprot:XP_012210574.1 hypothetical protein SPRG_15933 [Saprolegnia parasitica CBS 223.65]
MKRHNVPQTPILRTHLLHVYARAQVKAVVRLARSNIAPPEAVNPIIQERTEFDDEGKVIDLDRPGRQDVYSDDNMGYDEDDWEGEEDLDWDESGEVGSVERVRGLTPTERDELERYLRPHRTKAQEEADEADALLAMDPDDVMRDMDPLKYNPVDLDNFTSFQEDNIATAQRIYDDALEANGPSTELLNAALSVLTNALRIQRALDFVATEFPKHDLAPDALTYRSLMRMFLRAKRIKRAEALIGEAKAAGVAPDADFYGYLVDYYARQNRLRSALSTLEEMDRLGLNLHPKLAYNLRKLTQKYRVYTELLDEDPNAIHAMSHHGLMTMRKERARQIAANRAAGRKFFIPRRSDV